MLYAEPIENPAGIINTVTLGAGAGAITVGGEKSLPFHLFDGEAPNPPRLAMEVYDAAPDGWPASLTDAIGDVIADPVAWAKACVDMWGADIVCVQLASTDPDGADRTPDEAAATVKAIAAAVNVPLVVYGCGNAARDAETLKKVAEAVSDTVLAIGSATEENYKPIAAAAIAYGHVVVAETPIDVNMAKQLNILMTQMGLPADRILIDPSVGAVGYGVEYAFTVMQRLRLAAVNQNDSMCQMPMICNLGREAWRTKEARATEAEEPAWGDADKRSVLWEASTAITFALSGADVLVMRHPQAVATVRSAINSLLDQ